MTSPVQTLGDLGEFATIALIRTWLDSHATSHPDATIRTGPGDDVAVTSAPDDCDLLLTCDVQVAGRHFIPAWMTPEEIGRRAFEVSASDIAAKGGDVLWVLLSLGLPMEFRIDHLERCYSGVLAGLAAAGSGTVVGGNLSSTSHENWFFDVTVVGASPRGRAPLRSSARVGDRVFVTGLPGSAAAGLELLAAAAGGLRDGAPESRIDARARVAALGAPMDAWSRAYCAPRARLAFGRELVAGGYVHAILDTSDGLLGDLFHICEASRVAASLELERVAFPPFDQAILDRLGVDAAGLPWRWVLGPSDDYELLFTAPPSVEPAVTRLAAAHGVAVRRIGEISAGTAGIALRGAGFPEGELWTPGSASGGWDHFGYGSKNWADRA